MERTEIPWTINLIAPGIFQWLVRGPRDGIKWGALFLLTSPMVIPGIIVYLLALRDAYRIREWGG